MPLDHRRSTGATRRGHNLRVLQDPRAVGVTSRRHYRFPVGEEPDEAVVRSVDRAIDSSTGCTQSAHRDLERLTLGYVRWGASVASEILEPSPTLPRDRYDRGGCGTWGAGVRGSLAQTDINLLWLRRPTPNPPRSAGRSTGQGQLRTACMKQPSMRTRTRCWSCTPGRQGPSCQPAAAAPGSISGVEGCRPRPTPSSVRTS